MKIYLRVASYRLDEVEGFLEIFDNDVIFNFYIYWIHITKGFICKSWA